MAPIRQSGLAVVNFFYDNDDSLMHTRLYYQDNEGNIHEKRLSNSSGSESNEDVVIGKGRVHTDIVAVAWSGHVCINTTYEYLVA